MALAIPASLLAAWAPSDEVLVRRAGRRRARGGHGLPDDAGADHRALVGARAHEVDRAVVGARRRDRGARPAALGLPARALLVGLGVPDHAAARGRRARAGAGCSSRPTSTRRPSRSTTSAAILSVVLVGALILAINFAPVPNEGALALGLAAIALARAASPSTSASAARRTRSTTSTSRRGASSGWRPAPGSSCSAR